MSFNTKNIDLNHELYKVIRTIQRGDSNGAVDELQEIIRLVPSKLQEYFYDGYDAGYDYAMKSIKEVSND